uniref:Uncharacterized protein n=1 Tax=Strix occidentalis caurina TaxID=311401 RepID=A0A8D0EQF4_STROC
MKNKVKGATLGAAVGVGEGPALGGQRWGSLPSALPRLGGGGELGGAEVARGDLGAAARGETALACAWKSVCTAAAALNASSLLSRSLSSPRMGGSPSLHPAAPSPRSDTSVLAGRPDRAGVALVGIPAGIWALGFTATGIAAGSVAAKMMSAVAIANSGAVPAGSAVAVLQSVGEWGDAIGLLGHLGTLLAHVQLAGP